MSAENKNTLEKEVTLKEIILKLQEWMSFFWRKKWLIVAAGVLGMILGLGLALKSTKSYIATTTFVLESGEKAGGLGAYSGLASMVGIDVNNGGDIFQGDNILELYKSRKMLEKTLQSFVDTNSKQTLGDRYVQVNGLREALDSDLKLNKFDFRSIPKDSKQLRFRDSLIGLIVNAIKKNQLSVEKLDKKLSIIKVDMVSGDEIFAKRFNEELVKNVGSFYIQTKTQKSLDNISALQHKVDSVKNAMNGAIYKSVAIADATPNTNPTRQVQRVAPMQRAQFSVETNKAILSELVKNLEMAKMNLMRESPLIQVLDEPKYPLNTEKLSKKNAIVLGAVLFGFVAAFLLMIKKIYKDIING